MNTPEIPVLKDKRMLRIWANNQRLRLEIKEMNRRIQAQLISWGCFQQAKTICAYLAKADELDISPLFSRFPDKNWYLPRVYPNFTLMFHRFHEGDTLFKNRFGIEEPLKTAPLLHFPTEADLILLPGLMFDRFGNRLGYGQGYYDRYLQDWKTRKFPVLAGITVESLVSREIIPVLDWDVPVRYLVTENHVLQTLSSLDGDPASS